jgi:peptidyl-prolyl cis-trans isomerase D
MKTQSNKISYFILTFIFLIIIASFLFSGFDNFSLGGGQNVATVDGTPVTAKEYQMAMNRQVEFFNQMMGGQLTQKQLEEMGIKQSVLSGLIQQKLILNAAASMGIVVSLDEVKNEIKNMPYFKTNGQFDVNLYRNMLQGNGYVPAQFEELIANDLKQKKIDDLFNTLMISSDYVQEIAKFKKNEVIVQGVKISRQSLAPLISVSEKEVQEYLANAENLKALETTYTENFGTYNKPAEVKARHILIQDEDSKGLDKIKAIKAKVNAKNFAEIAKKETQDPTGKDNGGDLGWFSTGRMVPEFEKVAFDMKVGDISAPVKTQFGYHLIYVEGKKAAQTKSFESVKSELARMNIQKTKASDLDKLLASTAKEVEEALRNNNISKIEALAAKVDGQVFKKNEVNQYDQTLGMNSLAPQEVDQLFKASVGSVVDFGNPGTIFLLKVAEKRTGKDLKPEELTSEMTTQGQAYSRRVREEVMKTLNNNAKVVTNQSLL